VFKLARPGLRPGLHSIRRRAWCYILSLCFAVPLEPRFRAARLPVTRTIMPAQHDEVPTATATPGKAKRKDLSIVARNLMMVAVGVVVFAIVATIVLYGPLTYGDQIPNFGIILMLTVPVIAGVAFRVGLDAWLERK
jgi:hypothetical protein